VDFVTVAREFIRRGGATLSAETQIPRTAHVSQALSAFRHERPLFSVLETRKKVIAPKKKMRKPRIHL
jgi:hypothetical protein